MTMTLTLATTSQAYLSSASRQRILLIEASKPLSRALEMVLGRQFQVVLAEDGAEAIELLAKDHFDLVLLDLIVPVVDGHGVISWLRGENQSHTPILIYSSNISAEEKKFYEAMDSVSTVQKPVDMKRLFSIIEANLRTA